MAKLKDGFYKQTAEAVGSDSYMLLAGGGSKALSDFATSSEVVTALGTNGNYVTWTKNGTVNNLTVPYATNADKLDNIDSTEFFVTNRGSADTSYIDLTTYTSGHADYKNYNSGTYNVSRSNYSETYVVFRATGSTSAIELMTTYRDAARLKLRKTVDSKRVSGPWRELAFTSDIPTSLPANGGTSNGTYYVYDYNATTTPIYIGWASSALTSSNAAALAAYGTTSSGARCIKDITAAEAKKYIGLGNVQNTAFYKRVVTVNGSGWDMAGINSNAAFTIYAPTTAGTSGQVLTSTGGTPGWSNQSDLSVGFATHIKQKSSLTNLTTYKTVKAIKDQLVTEFANISEGIGANVTVPEQAISNWDNEDVTLSASSVYSMIKIGGGYKGTIYGQWLLSSYNRSRIGYVGRTSSTWSSIRWIATTDDLTNYMKATKENGYYGLTTPEGSSSAYIRTTSNGLLPYQSGGITNGHCYIGTSAWYFNQAYITKVNCNTVESSVDLFINGTSSIQLKTNTNQSAVVLNTTQFKPFDTANNKLTLGSDTARWANTYSFKGNFSGQITSSVATGTSPFSITSTTKNTNLNADMIDGYHIVVTDTVPAVPANKTIYFIY